MIRDPSDGSVRDHTGPICKGCGLEFYYDFVPRPNDYSGYCENCFEKSAPDLLSPLPSGESNPSVMLDCSGADTNSGLPLASTKPENIAKLERSREWLRKYRTDPESVARLNGEQGK